MAQGQRAGLITLRSQDRNLLPVFHIRAIYQNLPTLSLQTATLHRYGAAGARGAHNPEVTGSKPVAGISHSGGLSEPPNAVTTDSNTTPLSSSEERTAHNREVTGSTPVGGISHSGGLSEPPNAVTTDSNTSPL